MVTNPPTTNVGIGTTPLSLFHVHDGSVVLNGDVGDVPAGLSTSTLPTVLWAPGVPAFRVALSPESGELDEANIGENSVAIGGLVKAPAVKATALGYNLLSNQSLGLIIGSGQWWGGTDPLETTFLGAIAIGSNSTTPAIHIMPGWEDEAGGVAINMASDESSGSQLQINGNCAIGYSTTRSTQTNGLAVAGHVGIGNPGNAVTTLYVTESNTSTSNHVLVADRHNVTTNNTPNGVFMVSGGDEEYRNNAVLLKFGQRTSTASGTLITKASVFGNGDIKTEGNIQSEGVVCAKGYYASPTPDCVPDYVFEKNYRLRPLSELETYLKASKHLPNIPSAKEIGDNGQNIGELQLQMLEKIEELTLYILQQQKEIEELKLQFQNR